MLADDLGRLSVEEKTPAVVARVPCAVSDVAVVTASGCVVCDSTGSGLELEVENDVSDAVAVLIGSVTALCSAGVDGCGRVVAVEVVDAVTGDVSGDVAADVGVCDGAEHLGSVLVAVVVGVAVVVVGVAETFVDGSVAVVVDVVALLDGVRVDGSVLVVAVAVLEGVAGLHRIGLGAELGLVALVSEAVSVGVDVVDGPVVEQTVAVRVESVSAVFGGADVDACIRVIAVGAAALGVGLTVVVDVVVDVTIAVAIEIVAAHGGAGIDRAVLVVAVAALFNEAVRGVASGVIVLIRGESVAVVVEEVRDGAFEVVVVVVGVSVAVVVDAVADLTGAGVDGRVGVVAVLICGVTISV